MWQRSVIGSVVGGVADTSIISRVAVPVKLERRGGLGC